MTILAQIGWAGSGHGDRKPTVAPIKRLGSAEVVVLFVTRIATGRGPMGEMLPFRSVSVRQSTRRATPWARLFNDGGVRCHSRCEKDDMKLSRPVILVIAQDFNVLFARFKNTEGTEGREHYRWPCRAASSSQMDMSIEPGQSDPKGS